MRLRKKRPLVRDETIFRDARLVVIATEGQKTEPFYLSNFGDSRVQLKILPSENGKTSPEQVLAALVGFSAEYDIGDMDELWLVVDVDHWNENGNLQPVVSECNRLGYRLAVSNPCFELWLLVHFEDVKKEEIKCKSLQQRIRAHTSYSKSKIDFRAYHDKVLKALERADRITDNEYVPSNPGTNVRLLIKSLMSL